MCISLARRARGAAAPPPEGALYAAGARSMPIRLPRPRFGLYNII